MANLEALAETGSLIYAGRGDVDATFDVVLDTLNALMNDQERRRDLGRTASGLVDGLGGQRVVGYAAHLDKRPI